MTVTADARLAVCGCGAAGAIAGGLSGIRATFTHDHEYPWELQHGKLPGVRNWLVLAAVNVMLGVQASAVVYREDRPR